jgi:hypothetical protein
MGGVRTTVSKLIKGLRLEGFHVSTISLQHINLLAKLYSDMINLKKLRNFDVIIYMGSIPWPSHVFVNDATLIALFVHGFIRQELLNSIKQGGFRVGLGATLLLSLWNISKLMSKIDLFICRCYTSSEVNGICENYVLLPEFVFLDEVKYYEKLAEELRENKHGSMKVRISTYTSYAESPRLLKTQRVEHIIKYVSRRTGKKIELLIVDPRRESKTVKLAENLTVRYLRPMPREEFFKYVVNSDLFIELCIDEEIRNTSIEAALLGTPIAKLTHPKFMDRKDYGEDCLLQAYSFKELANKITEYVNNIEQYKLTYSKKFRNFIIKHRTWDIVKGPLIDYIKSFQC